MPTNKSDTDFNLSLVLPMFVHQYQTDHFVIQVYVQIERFVT